jgi:NitT/TauT family transport system substrate-binding protein
VPQAIGAEGSLETTTVRISKDLSICEAPLYVAAELLRAEGFTDIRYVDTTVDDPSTPVAPTRVARSLVDGGVTPGYDYALQTLNDIPYNNWREYDPEDTIRFYALRMREAGLIKSTPQKIIADNTDWRFLDELKRELKA